MFTDSHAHLSSEKFEQDLEHVLERAKEAGVERIINVAYDGESIDKSLSLIKKYPQIYLALGIHPEELGDWNEQVADRIRELSQLKKVLAIGEIGLDFYWKPFDAAQQKEIFVTQLKLAQELELPVIVHSRAAEAESLACIKDLGIKRGVLHCYTGPQEVMEEALSQGFFISFAGMLTYPKNDELRELLKQVPLDRLLLETDSPYLAPQSKRGKRNEPAFLLETATVIADLKNISLSELFKFTEQNVERLFFE